MGGGLGPVGRFSVALAAVLALTAGAIALATGFLIGRYVEDQTVEQTRSAVEKHFGTVFAEDVFTRSLSKSEGDFLQMVVRFHFEIYDIVATRFYGQDGTIVFSYAPEEIGQRPKVELSVDLLSILAWLDGTLGPHIAWEEGWLYPEIDARIGTPWATRAARFDHQQVRVMAARLREDQHLLSRRETGDPQVETRCHLFSLEALLRAHIEREERFLIPLLGSIGTAPALIALFLYALLPIVQPLKSFQRLGTTSVEFTQGDLNGRLEQWRQGMASFVEHPLLGVGSNMYRSVNSLGKEAHNSFVSVLVELGLIGLVLFGIVLVIAIIHALAQPRWDRNFWLTVLLVWAVGASTLTWEYRKTTWMFLTLLAASAALASRRDRALPSAHPGLPTRLARG